MIDHRTGRWVGAGLLAIVVTGCAGPSASGTDQPGVQGPASVAPGPAGAAQRYTVAQSSIKDLTAVLDANGVDDAGRWAEIVKDAGPYPPGQAGQQQLRQVLARFGADPRDTEKITNSLVP